jgi:Zn-dependent protease with chaperone function
MAHELAHVQNRDILVSTIAATLAGAISILGNMLQWSAMLCGGRNNEEGSGGFVGFLLILQWRIRLTSWKGWRWVYDNWDSQEG